MIGLPTNNLADYMCITYIKWLKVTLLPVPCPLVSSGFSLAHLRPCSCILLQYVFFRRASGTKVTCLLAESNEKIKKIKREQICITVCVSDIAIKCCKREIHSGTIIIHSIILLQYQFKAGETQMNIVDLKYTVPCSG